MNIVNEPNDNSGWGGPWTEKKLNAFVKYVKAYLTIMNKYPKYKTIYFDGFAGSGERRVQENPEVLKLIELEEEEQNVYQGAAERLMRMDEPFTFDFYYFVEKNEASIEKLKAKLDVLPNAQNRKKVFRPGDCNKQVENLAKALQDDTLAALIFLDPFGMQVNWNSVANLKGTHSDIWVLLPTGVIVNRLLDRKGELKSSQKLESFFGLTEEEIRQWFYVKTGQGNLFSEYSEHVAKITAPIEKIAALYVERLGTVWKHVTPKPLVLKNRRGTPIFHFVFASNIPAAVNIAKDIIQKD